MLSPTMNKILLLLFSKSDEPDKKKKLHMHAILLWATKAIIDYGNSVFYT